MHKIQVLLLSVIFLSFSSTACAKALIEKDTPKSLVWKAYLPGKMDTSYLFGTIHIPLKKAFATIDTVTELMKKVDTVYFEIKYNKEELLKQSKMLLATKESEKLKNILSEENYLRIQTLAAEKLGAQAMVIDYIKPFGVVTLFTSVMIPSDTSGAMDFVLQDYAKSIGKEVKGLESIEEQMKIITSMSMEDQKDAVLEFLDKQEEIISDIDTLVQAYVEQDLEKIKSIMDSAFSESTYLSEEDFLDNRNVKMVNGIVNGCSSSSCLIGVGAAHLVGEKGLIFLLREKGFVLKPIL